MSRTLAIEQAVVGDTVRLVVPSPIGPVQLSVERGCLVAIGLLARPAASPARAEAFMQLVATQLQRYFSDPTWVFSLPLKPAGTVFQRRVWQRLQQIPPGSLMTYGQLAEELSSSPRAVGGACRANPCPLVVPCHRVVGAAGVGGYAGQRTGRLFAIKCWLLRHEGVELANDS